ncbi:hypothetical protein CBR_g48021 [Chara braunii]|uniref:Integrase zinc-binding domain-containing protein n=1 Tax=Chara braunii TaxID=69332 RepID=A0A388M246_CHABU|nr:hypothetical protein CBR_g48021 [Chara braunii]|eukprot:GBG88552.1 hypothetical protein CBR_g48021 [Chara braunii]
MVGSQFSPLTPRERELRELQQVERIREQLERDLKKATDREREIKNRTARPDTLEADKAELEGLDDSGMNEPMKVLRNNILSLHAHVDSRLDFMQNTLDQILDALTRPGFRPPAQSSLPLSAMSGPFPVQAGTQPSGTSATVAQTSSGPAVGATPPQQPVPQQGQQQGQWYPKTPMKPPLAFLGERKDEELNTWLRTVPVWVKAKRTLLEDEVVTAASYLEGKATKWLDGVVVKAGFGRRMADWAKSLTLDQFMKMVEARWHNPQEAQRATDAINNILSLHGHVDSRLDFMQNSLDQILDLLQRPGLRPAAQSLLPLTAMSGPFPVQAGTQPSGTYAAAAQTVASSSSSPATGAIPQPQQFVPPQGQQRSPWYPKTPMKPPLAFFGEKKDEELNTWLRTVPMWVRAKRTLQEEEVITVASYLEGKAAKWLDGIVAKAGFGRRMADWAKTLTLEEFLDMVEAHWHNPQQAQIATDVMLRLDQRRYKSVRELTSTVENLIVVPGHEVSAERIRPEDAKVASIRDWPRPQTVTEVKSFLGMCGYYKNFVKNYSMVASSLTDLTRLDTSWDWSDECEAAFKRLKHALMNHETLKWIKTQPALSDALKRWIEVIDQYDFKLEYLKGEYNKVADALSRRADYLGALVSEFGVFKETLSLVGAYQEDPVTMDIIRKLQAKDKAIEYEFVMVDGLLFLRKAGIERLVVPSSENLRSLFLGECHDTTGHFGYKKTSGNLIQRFWWPGMLDDAKEYVETCQICQRDKPRTQAPLGLLKPLPIPVGPGQSVSMDFMDTLVTSRSGKRHIFVIIDRFTKYARLIAMPETARTEHVIKLFMDNWCVILDCQSQSLVTEMSDSQASCGRRLLNNGQ